MSHVHAQIVMTLILKNQHKDFTRNRNTENNNVLLQKKQAVACLFQYMYLVVYCHQLPVVAVLTFSSTMHAAVSVLEVLHPE